MSVEANEARKKLRSEPISASGLSKMVKLLDKSLQEHDMACEDELHVVSANVLPVLLKCDPFESLCAQPSKRLYV